MYERVIVEVQSDDTVIAKASRVRKVVEGRGHVVHVEGAKVVVYANDSRDAEEEITKLLGEAGIPCYVEAENNS